MHTANSWSLDRIRSEVHLEQPLDLYLLAFVQCCSLALIYFCAYTIHPLPELFRFTEIVPRFTVEQQMRKRDRLAIAKKIYELIEELQQFGIQQLAGSAWYFENGAEGKGISFGYAGQDWVNKAQKDLKKLLDLAARKS